MSENLFKKRSSISQCLHPCTFVESKINSKVTVHNSKEIQASIRFNRLIKVTKNYLAYTELELIAEIGSYIGLFLGLSVFQLRGIFSIMIRFFTGKLINKKPLESIDIRSQCRFKFKNQQDILKNYVLFVF